MFKKVFFIVLFLGLIFGSFGFVKAQEEIELNFFYSKTCPICAQEKEFLAELEERYPEVEINQYEVVFNTANQEILVDFYERYKVPRHQWGLVPVIFTAEEYFVGFNQQVAQQIESCLEECIGIGNGGNGTSQEIKLPIIGTVDMSKMSLPVLTVVIAALDGFNPCAMWVLLLLIALLINTRSRRRMWLIAGTFIVASGIIYYLILSTWLNLFLLLSYVNLTRTLIGVLALVVGIWQIRNFVNYRRGVCKVTDGEAGIQEKIKMGLKKRAESIVTSPASLGIIFGIIILALGVNLVEFFCSAGLPAIYTKVLTMSDISSASYHLYLLLYTFIFMLDDIIIFSLAVFGLSRLKFTEKYNYWATLIGGLIILILGLLLIFKPELLMFI